MADVSVRPAVPDDANAIGRVQLRAWRAAYADSLPPEVLARADEASLAEPWREAAGASLPRHHLLVALDGAQVVGFAAAGPATDEDRDPAVVAELHALYVDPDHGRAGHGSRLLAATTDLLQADGYVGAVQWLLADDDALRRFLLGAGWDSDGATRDLDMGRLVHQVRLHTRFENGRSSDKSPA
jgi:GNAT superfamily N-acetyltransferase